MGIKKGVSALVDARLSRDKMANKTAALIVSENVQKIQGGLSSNRQKRRWL
jgi:hypothetical protein